jgi:hypothetical protein
MFRVTFSSGLKRNVQPDRGKKMVAKITLRKLIFVGILILTPLLIAACAQSVTQSERDKVPQQASGVTMLIGAQKLTPTPPPPTPPQKLTTPASYYEPVGPFFFYVETLTANTNPNKYGFAPTVACIQSGVFKRGMKIVVRFEVLDTKTGKRVTDKDGATIKMILPHGEEVIARWTIRGSAAALPDSAWMWDTSWDIPPDYPVGALDYRIVVTTKDGRTGTFTPPIQKTATADTRVRIID